MRRIDDLADDSPTPEAARKAVRDWIQSTHEAFQPPSLTVSPDSHPHPSQTLYSNDPLWPSFREIIARYNIPSQYFDEIAEGALMDQEVFRYKSFEDLYLYCYRVASVVGLVCLKVFEYKDPRVEHYGEALGIAFQLTNILRDIKEDAERNRIYIPQEDLQKFGVTEDEILQSQWSDRMHALLKFSAQRANDYYQKAAPSFALVSAEARPTLRIMNEIYFGILNGIQSANYQVFDQRIRIPTWKKLWIVVKNYLFSSPQS
jgi:phytoene synthase